MEPLLGQIVLFAGTFAPRGWALCDGQLLSISQHTALFSLLGTNYGGDGRTTFALPDLRGRVPIHPGRGPGLTTRELGQAGGEEATTPAPVTVEAVEPMHPDATQVAAAGPRSTMQPWVCMNYIIAIQGLYPSRS